MNWSKHLSRPLSLYLVVFTACFSFLLFLLLPASQVFRPGIELYLCLFHPFPCSISCVHVQRWSGWIYLNFFRRGCICENATSSDSDKLLLENVLTQLCCPFPITKKFMSNKKALEMETKAFTLFGGGDAILYLHCPPLSPLSLSSTVSHPHPLHPHPPCSSSSWLKDQCQDNEDRVLICRTLSGWKWILGGKKKPSCVELRTKLTYLESCLTSVGFEGVYLIAPYFFFYSVVTYYHLTIWCLHFYAVIFPTCTPLFGCSDPLFSWASLKFHPTGKEGSRKSWACFHVPLHSQTRINCSCLVCAFR